MNKAIATLALAATTLAASAQTTIDATESRSPRESIQELPTTTVVTSELWQSEIEAATASVTVLDDATLDTGGTRHFEDIVQSIPNLTWTGGTSRPRYLQIRGIGENSQFEGETPDSSVRFLIDNIDLTGLGTVGSLFDARQVEVLRGPQAGAFGANAAGGLVRIITNEPTPFWTGHVETTVGSDDLRSGGVAVGGPLLESSPERLTFRLALQRLVSDGFIENEFRDADDTNERDEASARLKLRWQPDGDWQWDGTLLYADADNGYDVFSLDNTAWKTQTDEPGRDAQESLGASVKGRWAGAGSFTFTSLTGMTVTDSLYSYDADWGAGFGAPAPFQSGYTGFLSTEREREVLSQEFRLDSAARENALGWIDRWTLGLFFEMLEEDSFVEYVEQGSGFATVDSLYETETAAAFAQVSKQLADDRRLILGLRAEHHSVDFASSANDQYTFATVLDGRSSQDSPLFGAKLTLEQDIGADHMVFASAARGYKAGGANSGSFRFAFDPPTYDHETLYNFELGSRNEWLDGRLRANVTAFYLHRKNTQLRDSAGAGGFFRYLTVNGEAAAHYGLEADVAWQPDDRWTVSLALGLLETERDAYTTVDSDENVAPGRDADTDDDPVSVRIPGRDLSNAPSYAYRLSLDYDEGDGLFGNLSLTGKDDYYESNSHDERRDAFTRVDASLGYRWDNWALTVWARNLFEEAYANRVFYFDNFHPDDGFAPTDRRYEALAAPRTFGITATYRW